MRRVHTATVLAGSVLVGALLLAGCGDGDDGVASDPTTTTTTATTAPTTSSEATTTTTAVPVTVEEALAAFDFGGGAPYAGDCEATVLEEDAGAWCTTLEEDRGTTRIYGAGPTFSEYTTWLLLEQGPGGWAVVDTASQGELGDLQPPPW